MKLSIMNLYPDHINLFKKYETTIRKLSVDIHKILNQYWIFYVIKMVARRENREKEYLEKEAKPYALVSGQGSARTMNALRALEALGILP